jgi:hypothetical protein
VIAGPHTLINRTDGLVVNANGLYASSAGAPQIERFSRDAVGDAAPLAVISGKRTRIRHLDSMIAGLGSVYAAQTSPPSILKFAPLANGDVRPRADISGPNTQLTFPTWLYVR